MRCWPNKEAERKGFTDSRTQIKGLRKMIYKILKKMYSFFEKNYNKCKRKIYSERYSLIRDAEKVFECIRTIEEERFEEFEIPNIYDYTYDAKMTVKCPAIKIFHMKDAIVSAHSDIIVTDKGVSWRKIESPLFSKSNPTDYDFVSLQGDAIWVQKKKTIKILDGNNFSLLGQFDYLWSHFLMQFFPKLVYASENGLLDKQIRILIPEVTDQNVIDAIHIIIDKYSNVELYSVKVGVGYKCENLYYVNAVDMYTNDADFQITQDTLIPRCTIDAIRRGLVDEILKIENCKTYPQKLYLIRRDVMRTLVNWREVEEYFRQQGFSLIEGKELNLVDKIFMFNQATEIVGVGSGAFFSTIACENAKLLIFSNIQRTVEATALNLVSGKNNTMLCVMGEDEFSSKSNHLHTSFYIPLKKIKAAYQSLIVNERNEEK